jgi:uncharacterized protein (UPF0303 family)
VRRSKDDLRGKFRLDSDRYAAHGGAFPLTIDHVGVVGVIAVSGPPSAKTTASLSTSSARHLAAG